MNQAQISYEIVLEEFYGAPLALNIEGVRGMRPSTELVPLNELESALARIKDLPGVQNIQVSVKEDGKWVRHTP